MENMESTESIEQDTQSQGASLEDLGLEVVDNDNVQISLMRPVRHILAVDPIS